MKQTLQEKLEKKHFNRPPRIIYPILKKVVLESLSKKWNTEYIFKVDTKKVKGPFVVVFNHQSRNDYVFTAMAFPKTRLNFVAGYNEFFRSHLKFIFGLAGAIPKRNFVPDIHTIKECMRIIKKDGAICISPEGMSSISGSNQPIAIGTGKFLKHLNVPVYFVNIKGAYLMAPKYCLDDRIGKVTVTTDIMFSKSDLSKLTPNQIEDIINEKFTHDDYEYNKIVKVDYKGDNFAKNMHTYLYKCPKCNSDFTMLGEKDKIYCTKCGNGATLDAYYNLTPIGDSVIFKTPKKWFEWQREEVYKEIKSSPNFVLSEEVELGCLPKYKPLKDYKTSEIVGKGVITLSRNGFSYKGTKDGKDIEFSIPTDRIPTYGMCTDMSRFYTFYEKEFYEFYPKTESVAKWLLATEELHRINGGSWKNFKSVDFYQE
jgi:1-acyl-sn-glycerol-3-phosphate acyltransferase